MGTEKTVKVKKYLDIIDEYNATAVAITPGMLIELTNSGGSAVVRAHSTAQGPALPMFALEDELQGNDIDTNYAASAKIQCWTPTRGDIVHGILADGYDIDIGDWLCSNGDGYLREFSPTSEGQAEYPNVIVGQAVEAVDTSGSSGEESSGTLGYARRIKFRAL